MTCKLKKNQYQYSRMEWILQEMNLNELKKSPKKVGEKKMT